VVPAEYRNSYEKNLDMVIITSYLFSYLFRLNKDFWISTRDLSQMIKMRTLENMIQLKIMSYSRSLIEL